MEPKQNIKTLTQTELSALFSEKGQPSFRAKQVYQWLFQKGVTSFDEMTNLSKDLRTWLSETFFIGTLRETSRQTSKDGTVKCLFDLGDGQLIESVLIPELYPDGVADRLTVCVSSQVGCVFGCRFCATGKMGFFRNLHEWEIADQWLKMNAIAWENHQKQITNVVYMGMGEPLHNYASVIASTKILTDPLGIGLSPKRITVSTVGLSQMIKRLGDEMQPFNLAISLHAANDEKRTKIMPVNDRTDLSVLKEALIHYHQKTEKPVTYEYLLFNEFNDSSLDARELAEIATWIPSKVNIIMYNNVAGVPLQRAAEKRLDSFLGALSKAGVLATVRRSRGDDIDAGCGQLAVRDGRKGKSIAKEPVNADTI
jgi:23S rRNA (adenine2503-C2)-methyltransferase